MNSKYHPTNLILHIYNYIEWFKESDKESADIPSIPPLEGDQEDVKERKEINILTPNKLLTRLPVLLAQTKAGNNSYKLENKFRQILYLLYQHNEMFKTFITI